MSKKLGNDNNITNDIVIPKKRGRKSKKDIEEALKNKNETIENIIVKIEEIETINHIDEVNMNSDNELDNLNSTIDNKKMLQSLKIS